MHYHRYKSVFKTLGFFHMETNSL